MAPELPLTARLAVRADRIAWANLVEDTKAMWEPRGFRVHVNSNERRIVISPSLGRMLEARRGT